MIVIKSIEDDIPVPPVTGGGSTNRQIRSMRPGQSFMLAGRKRDELTSWRSYWARRGIRFDVRKVDGGIRVWCRSNALLAEAGESNENTNHPGKGAR